MAFDFMNFDLNQDVVRRPVDGELPDEAPPVPNNPPRPRPVPQRSVRPLGVQPMDFASLGPMGQAAVLNNMTSDVNNVIDKEMGSRVMQAREEKQRQHERELMAMRMQMARQQNEGDIIRSLLNG